MSSYLARNVSLSVVQTVTSGLVLFLLYRYLIVHLGPEQLGLWSVILAGTSVAGLSDMGLTGSVVKFVARYRALGDGDGAASIVETAAISIAVIMGALILAAYPLFEKILALALPASSMAQALGILPWAVLSFWLTSVGGVFQSGLDGCQRMDIRNIAMIVGNILLLGVAVFLVPRYGLPGLALAQVVQGLLMALIGWIMLRRELNPLGYLPLRWSTAKFREMLGYAAGFQINSIALLLFVPTTKLLVSRFGGLSSAAYYEMASQMVLKLRAIIISANQALTPAIAELHETAPDKVRDLYLKSYQILFFVAVPFYAGIYIALPVISELWLGHVDQQFLLFGALLVGGYGVCNLIGPAYFVNLGTGHLKWNVVSHVTMGGLNLLFGWYFGEAFAGGGVVFGSMLAMTLASSFVLVGVHRQYKVPFAEIIPAIHRVLLWVLLSFVGLSAWFNKFETSNASALHVGLVNLVLFFLIAIAVVWVHPYKRGLFARWQASWREGR